MKPRLSRPVFLLAGSACVLVCCERVNPKPTPAPSGKPPAATDPSRESKPTPAEQPSADEHRAPMATTPEPPTPDRRDAMTKLLKLEESIWLHRAESKFVDAAREATEAEELAKHAHGHASIAAADAARLRVLMDACAADTPERQQSFARADTLEASLPRNLQTREFDQAIAAALECRDLRSGLLGETHPETTRAAAWLAASELAAKSDPADESTEHPSSTPMFSRPADIIARLVNLPEDDWADLPGTVKPDQIAQLVQEHKGGAFSALTVCDMLATAGRYETAALFAEAAGLLSQAGTQSAASADELLIDVLAVHVSQLQPQCQQACEILLAFGRSLGENHPEYAEGLELMARLRIAERRLEDAKVLAGEALRIRAASLPSNHPALLRSLGLCAAVDLLQQPPALQPALQRLDLVASGFRSLTGGRDLEFMPPEMQSLLPDPVAATAFERAVAQLPRSIVPLEAPVPTAPGPAAIGPAAGAQEAAAEATLRMLEEAILATARGLGRDPSTLTEEQQAFASLSLRLMMLKEMRADPAEDADASIVIPKERLESRIGELRKELYDADPPESEAGDDELIRRRERELKMPGLESLERFEAFLSDQEGADKRLTSGMQRALTAGLAASLFPSVETMKLTEAVLAASEEAEALLAKADHQSAERKLVFACELLNRIPSSGSALDDNILRPAVRLAWLRYCSGRLTESRTIYEGLLRRLGPDSSLGLWGATAFEGLSRVCDAQGEFLRAVEVRADMRERRSSEPEIGHRPELDPVYRPWIGWRKELQELEEQAKKGIPEKPADPFANLSPEDRKFLEANPQLLEAMKQQANSPELRKMMAMMGQGGLQGGAPRSERIVELKRLIEESRTDELADEARISLQNGDAKHAESLYGEAVRLLRSRPKDPDQQNQPLAFIQMLGGTRATLLSCLTGLTDSLEAQERLNEAAAAWRQAMAAPDDKFDPPSAAPKAAVLAEQHARLAWLVASDTMAAPDASKFAATQVVIDAAELHCVEALKQESLPGEPGSVLDAFPSLTDEQLLQATWSVRALARLLESRSLLQQAKGDMAGSISLCADAARLHDLLVSEHFSVRMSRKLDEETRKNPPNGLPPGLDLGKLLGQPGAFGPASLWGSLLPSLEGHRVDSLRVWHRLGQLRALAGHRDFAIEAFSRSLRTARDLHSDSLWRVATEFANLLREAGREADAIPLYVEALDELDRSRDRRTGDEIRRSAAEVPMMRALDPQGGLIRACLAIDRSPGGIKRAISVLERGRGRYLRDLLSRSGQDPLTALAGRAVRSGDRDLALRAGSALEHLQAARRAADKFLAGAQSRSSQSTPVLPGMANPEANSGANGPTPHEQYADLCGRVQAAEAGLARMLRGNVELRELSVLPSSLIAASLAPGEILLAYEVGENDSLLFVCEPGRDAQVFELDVEGQPATAEVLASLVAKFNRYAFEGTSAKQNEYRDNAEAANRLARSIVPEAIRERLQLASRVMIIPDGALHRVAFDALPTSNVRPDSSPELWIDVWPPHVQGASASALLKSRAEPRKTDSSRAGMLIAANPTLPAASTEAAAVEQIAIAAGGAFLPVKAFVGAKVKLPDVREAASTAVFVHFAAHGSYSDGPEVLASRVLLSDTESVSLMDLLVDWGGRLDGVKLVSLAACETAAGSLQGSDGIVALPWGFQYAGADSVLAAIWRVPDLSTSMLIERFYASIAGQFETPRVVGGTTYMPGQTLPLASALAEAKRWLRGQSSKGESLAEPYFWAGFVLIGSGD